jgi:hypothetical protein
MGGRLSLTMHRASVGSWASPQNPRSRLQGVRPDETSPSYGLNTAANGADRRPCRRQHRPRAETSFAAKALVEDASAGAAVQKSPRRA